MRVSVFTDISPSDSSHHEAIQKLSQNSWRKRRIVKARGDLFIILQSLQQATASKVNKTALL
jgi:hypothetical protein